MSFVTTASAALGIATVGNIIQGVGQFIQGKDEVALGNYNAQISEQRAEAERQSFTLLEGQKRKLAKSQVGTQVALYAKSGVKMSGSPIQVMLDSLTNSEMDIAVDKYNSEVAARGYTSQAAVTRYEAQQRAKVSYAQGTKTLLSTAANYITANRKIKVGE